MAQRIAALTSYELILAGGGESGSGGNGNTEDLPTITDYTLVEKGSISNVISFVDLRNNNTIEANASNLQSYFDDYVICIFTSNNSIPDFKSVRIITSDSPIYLYVNTSFLSGDTAKLYCRVYNFNSDSITVREINTNIRKANDDSYYLDSSITLDANRTISSGGNYSFNYSNVYSGYLSMSAVRYGVSSPIPPTNWPDPEPSTPIEPPEVPTPETPTTPTEPTTPTVTPTTPPEPPSNPTVPIFPILNTEPDVTYVTADLSAVLDAMNEHCQHLQTAIHNAASNLYSNVSQVLSQNLANLKTFIRQQVSWLGGVIQQEHSADRSYLNQLFSWLNGNVASYFSDLADYLQDLFEWLARQMDFSVTGGEYDDNTVVSWLMKIYSKLGGGSNTKPVDPVQDPFGIGEWFNSLLQNLVLDLLALGQDWLADIVESLRELIQKFPFCIPWDIAAMLALLAAEPVAPAFDCPWPYVDASGVRTDVLLEVDLSDYDLYMVPVRNMEKILFAFYLAFKTDFFMGVLKNVKGDA